MTSTDTRKNLDPDGAAYFEKDGILYRWMPDGTKPAPDEFAVAFVERQSSTGREHTGRLLIPGGDGHVARRLLAAFSAVSDEWWYRLAE